MRKSNVRIGYNKVVVEDEGKDEGGDVPFSIVTGDILDVHADAVVVAANEQLAITGGMGLRVALAAGRRKLQRACDAHGVCPTGTAAITPAFSLPAKHIVHVVGPIWRGGGAGEEALLAQAYASALKAAYDAGDASVAMPLISAGTYGYPVDQALSIAVRATRKFLEDHDLDVTLVLYDRRAVLAGLRDAEGLSRYLTDMHFRTDLLASPSGKSGAAQIGPFDGTMTMPLGAFQATPFGADDLEDTGALPPIADAGHAAHHSAALDPEDTGALPPIAEAAGAYSYPASDSEDASVLPSIAVGDYAAHQPAAGIGDASDPAQRNDIPGYLKEDPWEATYGICPHCGYPLRDGARFCSQCGGTQAIYHHAPTVPMAAAAASATAATAAPMTSAAPATAAAPAAPAMAAAPAAPATAPAAASSPATREPAKKKPFWKPASAPDEAKNADLDAWLAQADESLSTMLLSLIDSRGLTDAQVYKRANISRQVFNKIKNDPGYHPKKPTVLALCVALELDVPQTCEVLARAGYALNPSSRFDLIVEYHITRGCFDHFQINEALFAYDQPLLGAC